jgi:outer membrane protein OmpA-like peptidoglycan-associated protein
VRVHSDTKAEEVAEAAQSVNALAYTVGRDVVFGAGQFVPRTTGGQKVMAHELAHIAQPKEGGSRGLSQPGDSAEREAERAADKLATGQTVRVGAAPGAAMQRQPLPNSKGAAAGDTLIKNASPFLAAALSSAMLDHFDTGKSEIKADHKTQLASVAHSVQVLLWKYNMSTVTVVGRADTVGKEVNNLQLGQDRADTVKQALSDLGVPEALISAESEGKGSGLDL